eukprot:TRINITY_DN30325_c0_g1_i2.p1 TRINITY_DN30325_c0_g1~~TRINITY_DN30325_c0_g1_i2.p1  ORF type:complete len:674 (-),score=155.45 TRINITY_DN30325_c0_g1_i2:178-2112(-)
MPSPHLTFGYGVQSSSFQMNPATSAGAAQSMGQQLHLSGLPPLPHGPPPPPGLAMGWPMGVPAPPGPLPMGVLGARGGVAGFPPLPCGGYVPQVPGSAPPMLSHNVAMMSGSAVGSSADVSYSSGGGERGSRGKGSLTATNVTADEEALGMGGASGSASDPRASSVDASFGSGSAAPGGTSDASDVAAKPRSCHLHNRPNKNCKTCQRVQKNAAASSSPAGAISETKEESRKEGQKGSVEDTNKLATFNCSAMIKDQILKSSYFKSLMQIATPEALAEEIQNYADSIDVYQAGSATSPSVFFCCVFRLFTLEHSEEELQMILDHMESAYVRCVGLLFVRFSVKPDKLWETLEEYMLDDMDMGIAKFKGGPRTIGEYVEELLMKEKYFGTPLPRLPVVVRRKIEERIAPLPQYRKRAQVNRRALKQFREVGTPVEVCLNGRWFKGQVQDVDNDLPSRPKLNVRLEEDHSEVPVHIGKVILRDLDDHSSDGSDGERHGRRRRSRSRSRRRTRTGSPDWTRDKGKSDNAMIKELRERVRDDAVCGSGKEYAKRPMGFEAGLAIRREQGSQETRLIEEETYNQTQRQPRRRTNAEDEDETDNSKLRRSDEEQERQRKLAQIYEKYGQQVASGSSKHRDVEGPDVMRFG